MIGRVDEAHILHNDLDERDSMETTTTAMRVLAVGPVPPPPVLPEVRDIEKGQGLRGIEFGVEDMFRDIK